MNEKYMKNDGHSDGIKDLITRLNDLESTLPMSIKNNVFNRLLYELETKRQFIDDCETPIEVLLGLEIRRDLEYLSGKNGLQYYLSPQQEIKINERKYRVDFLLAPVMTEGNLLYPNIVIECDGHDYHERTKEQAATDKSRDRALQKEGYRVVRFTGSEIVNNPKRCAWEVVHIVKQVEKSLGFGDYS